MSYRAIYGKASFIKAYCEDCETEAFIINGCYACCDSKYIKDNIDRTIYVTQKSNKRKAITTKERRGLIEQQNNRCFYCDCDLGGYYIRNNTLRKIKAHIDHVHPFSAVGNATEFVAACNVCNQIKSNKVFSSMDELIDHIKNRKRDKNIIHLE